MVAFFLSNARPYHNLSTTKLSTILFVAIFSNWRLFTFWPLLVITIYFLLGETAIFKGKSPRGIVFPTGLNDHPLGNFQFEKNDFSVCALAEVVNTKRANSK